MAAMADVSLPVLLAPLVIAGMAVAFMIVVTGGRETRDAAGPRSADKALGYGVDAQDAVSLAPARYVGGHPDVAAPLTQPYVLLTARDLALFRRKGLPVAFAIPWSAVETITRLTAEQMAMAAGSVRGLAPGALDDLDPGAIFARVRFADERGWWQNVVLELAPGFAEQQLEELTGRWHLAKAGPAVGEGGDAV